MQYTIRLREWDEHPGVRSAYFDVKQGGEYYRNVQVSFSHMVVAVSDWTKGHSGKIEWPSEVFSGLRCAGLRTGFGRD
jgi:hypothetical protein